MLTYLQLMSKHRYKFPATSRKWGEATILIMIIAVVYLTFGFLLTTLLNKGKESAAARFGNFYALVNVFWVGIDLMNVGLYFAQAKRLPWINIQLVSHMALSARGVICRLLYGCCTQVTG